MALWAWAGAAYGRGAVAEVCLELQDSHGQSVPLLLWAGWAAVEGRPLGDGDVGAGCAIARVWQDAAVAPLRAVRRTLKPARPGMDDAARQDVRAKVAAAELRAERALLEALERLSPAGTGLPLPVPDGLVRVAQVWQPGTPPGALARLAALLDPPTA